MERATERCPDWFFSEGSTNEPDALFACAPSWSQVTGFELSGGITPPCARGGTRAVGESCLHASQCVSGVCSGRLDSCGVCQQPVLEGGSYSSEKTCAAGYQCSAARTCIPSSVGGAEFSILGEPCALELYSCVYGTMCVVASGSPTGGRCVVRGPGSSCGGDSCSDDAHCDGQTSTCHPLSVEGQACARGAGIYDRDCGRGLHRSLQRCIKGLALGEDCNLNSGECGEGMYCLAKPVPSQSGQWMLLREEGESCTAPLHFCTVGTSCSNGTCTYSDQGAFARECK